MVRIVEVIATAHPDSTTEDTKWEYVVIKAIKPVNRPVTLEQIKTRPEIEKMVLVKNARLSVQHMTEGQRGIICSMAEVTV